MSLIKIPFVFYKPDNSDVDYEALGIEPPKQDITEEIIKDVWVRYDIITTIEPNIDGDGCYIDLGKERSWLSPLSPDEVAKKINEA